MSQTSLWQTEQQNNDFAEVCNALYERELNQLVNADLSTARAVQSRLKSLPHYIKLTAYSMLQVLQQSQHNKAAKIPIILDHQNAHWSAKQSKTMPLLKQELEEVWQWYQSFSMPLGLVVPVWVGERILLDSIDRVDSERQRLRSNAFGWFDANNVQKQLFQQQEAQIEQSIQLLKPTKKVMLAACAGHRWQNNTPSSPVLLTLRELLLSCNINWQNFKKIAQLK